MTYNNLRTGRTSIPGQLYLVTTVTANRRSLFADFHLGRIVVAEMRAQDRSGATRTLAFVVMPDHVHWLFELKQAATLTVAVKLFKGRSAQALNRSRGTSAPVWQSSFHDHAVRNDEALVDVARYVVMNPVRAKLVERIGDYPLWDAAWL
jgi:putative transposase